MRIAWRVVLPAFGLILFALISADSVRRHKAGHHFYAGRYFYWSGIRLDSTPGKPPDKVCAEGAKNCLELADPIVDSGLLEKILFLLTIPAFLIGSAMVRGFARLGINETMTFFLVMPLLIGTWLYFLGWLVDRKVRSLVAAS